MRRTSAKQPTVRSVNTRSIAIPDGFQSGYRMVCTITMAGFEELESRELL